MIDTDIFRMLSFVAALAAMLAWEHWRPLRGDRGRPLRRWINMSLVLIDSLVLRLLLPLLAVGAAAIAADQNMGLFNELQWPEAVELGLSVLLLDLAIYWQHRLFHRIAPLWRIHAMHHSDIVLDTTTGLRFHPLEIVLSMLIKIVLVMLLGIPVAAVVLFEILLNASSLFNHGNVALPASLESRLRWGIVTPAMHRIHHSVHADEHHGNFGFMLSCWDRLFGSYRAEPREGQLGMTLGLSGFRQLDDQSLGRLLIQPFRRGPTPE